MKRLVWTAKFAKSADKFIKANTELTDLFKLRMKQLEDDPFQPNLKTHKLKGPLSGCYSSSINFYFRIVFQITPDEKIVLLNIGSHDEVY